MRTFLGSLRVLAGLCGTAWLVVADRLSPLQRIWVLREISPPLIVAGLVFLLVNEHFLNQPELHIAGTGWVARVVLALGTVAIGIAGAIASLQWMYVV